MRHALHSAGNNDFRIAGTESPCAARPTAFRPEPQTLLIVIAATSGSKPPRKRGLAGGILPQSGGDNVPHDDFVDLPGLETCAFNGRFNHQSPKLRRSQRLQSALEFPDRRTNGADNDNVASYDENTINAKATKARRHKEGRHQAIT